MVTISLFGSLWERFLWWDRSVNAIDAVGTPAFAMIGFQMSAIAGVPLVGALLVGSSTVLPAGYCAMSWWEMCPSCSVRDSSTGASCLLRCLYAWACWKAYV